MPTPRYTQQTQAGALPGAKLNVDTPIEAFGGGQASQNVMAAGDRLLETTTKIAQKAKQEADDTVVMDAAFKTQAETQRLMYDPENGALTKKGQNSFNVLKEYGTQYDQFADTISKDMTPTQRQMYEKVRMQNKMSLDGDLERHTFKEVQEYQAGVVKSGIEVNRNEALLNYDNPEKVRAAIEMQRVLVAETVKREGLDDDTAKLAMQSVESQTHTDVVNKYLTDNRDIDAEKYFKENIDGFTEKDKEILTKSLETGSLRGKSQRTVDDMMKKNMSVQQAQEYFRTIEDPKLRDAVSDRWRGEYTQMKQLKASQENDLFKSAYDIVEKDPSPNAVPPNVWNALDPASKNAIKALREKTIAGTDSTDPSAYYRLSNLAGNDRQAFLKMDLLKEKPHLSMGDFKKFADMQAESRKGSHAKLNTFLSDNQVVDIQMSQAGLDPKAKPTTAAGKRSAEFRTQVDIEVEKYTARTGKSPTNDDIRGITDRLLMQGITNKGFFFDDKKRQFELNGDEEFEDIVVPNNEATTIAAKLKKRGMPVNDDTIKRIYLKGLNSGG